MYWLIFDLTDVHQVPCGVGEAIAVRSCPKVSFVMGVSFETLTSLFAR